MSAIDIKEIGGVVADAELNWAPNGGKPYCKVRLGFSDPVWDDQTQKWKNVNQFYVEGTAWERTAEQLAEVATQGTQLLIWGKLITDQWEDKQTGENKSRPALKIRGFRPVGKLPQVGQQNQGGGFSGGNPAPQNTGQPDPWGGQPQSGAGWDTGQQTEAPF